MKTLAKLVRRLLESTGVQVWYFYPPHWMRLPALSWRQCSSRLWAQADGREYLTEYEYAVDAWAKSPEEVQTLAAAADSAMTSAGFQRVYGEDLYEDTLYRRALRYRCVANDEGKMYQ